MKEVREPLQQSQTVISYFPSKHTTTFRGFISILRKTKRAHVRTHTPSIKRSISVKPLIPSPKIHITIGSQCERIYVCPAIKRKQLILSLFIAPRDYLFLQLLQLFPLHVIVCAAEDKSLSERRKKTKK